MLINTTPQEEIKEKNSLILLLKNFVKFSIFYGEYITNRIS